MKTSPRAICLCLLFLAATVPAWSQVAITTQLYDTSRTGANLNETILTTSNVNSAQFGKLYSYTVSGSVHAQPLYVPNLSLPGLGIYNVLFVVTMNDVVYAFDADSNVTGPNGNGVLWTQNFTNPAAGVTPIPIVNIVGSNSLNIVGNVGIESTPVIDLTPGSPTINTMYLVARTMEVSGSTTNYVARLHALDITTGNEKFDGPVVIGGSVPGTGQGSSGGVLTFNPLIQNQRSGLALVNGLVVFSWASHEDDFDWHGWVFAYNAQTLQFSSIYCSSPNGANGGIWMSGRAPVIDSADNLYYATGNGDWDGETEFGDSVIKLGTAGGVLSLADYFTPDDYVSLQADDEDLGSSGPLLIPGTDLLVHGGKESLFYVLNTSGLGHEEANNSQVPEQFSTTFSQIHSGPVFLNTTTGLGPTLYVWPNSGPLQAYQFNGSTVSSTPNSVSNIVAVSGCCGGVLALSANANAAGSGIVWASTTTSQSGVHGLVAGTLRAFNASNLTTELWDSDMVPARDTLGLWPKYSTPVVDNGKVYLAAFPSDGVSPAPLNVYGLLSTQEFSISASPSSETVVVGNAATYTATIGALNGFSGVVTLSASGLPSGATYSFSPATVTGSGTSTLTVTTSGTTPVGLSTLTITGTSGSLTQMASVGLTVNATPPPPSFTLGVSPSSETVVAGNSTTYTTTIGALNGFSGVVTLSASGLPSGATWSFSPATVTGSGSSTLTVTTSATTPLATSTLTITGTSGSLTQTTSMTLTVTNSIIGIKFVGQGTAMASSEVAGVVAQLNWNDASGTTSTSPLALLDQAGTGTGATVTWSTNGTWKLPITDTPGNYRMMRGYLDTVGGTTTVTVAGLPANPGGYSVYVYADGDNGSATRTGAYQISGTGITTTSVNLIDAANTNFSGTFTPANNSAGNYVLFTINATGFTITATPGTSTDAYPRAPLNAIQIVPLTSGTANFSMTASPSSETVVVGNAATYTATIGALNGFSGVVTLSASGLPSGATYSFSPATVTGSGTSTLTVTTSGTTPVGLSTLTITGTSGSLTQMASVGLTVNATPPPPSFTLGVSPSSETVVAGNSTTYTTTIGALNGFSGVVTLSASGLPSGATWSFSPATVTGSGSSTLTVTTSATTPLATSTLTITGTSGSLTQTTSMTLTVTNSIIGIKFVGQGTAMASSEVAGVVAQLNWNDASGTTSTSPLALLDQAGTGTGATVTWSTNGTWKLPITDTPGNYRMMRGYLDTVGGTTTVTVAGLPANPGGYSVYVYADGDNGSATRTGAYQISGTGITTTSVNLIDAANTNFSGTFTPANNSAGNYVLFTINATGFTITATPGTSTDAYPRAPLNAIQIVPLTSGTANFSMTASPSSETVVVGNAATYTATIGALNGFSGVVTLSASGLPSGATYSFSPATVTGSGTSTLTVTTSGTTPVGLSTLTITGTSGSLTQMASVGLTVNATPPPPSFTLGVSPSSETVVAGNSTTYTTTIGALNGFSGVVTLSASGLPSGATWSFSPATVTGSGSSTLTVTTSATTPLATSTLTITGTSGSLTQTTSMTLTVTNSIIGIKFVGQGTAMASSEVAGVVAQLNWNDASGTTSTSPLALLDQAGTGTGATVTWSTNGTWKLPITDTPGNYRMMRGYLDTVGGTTTVTVAGLPANPGGYSVYVYADGDNGSATRTGAYQISGTGITTTSVNLIDAANTNFSGTFTPANNSAGNYVLFTINATGFTITATPGTSTDAYPRAPLNAIQIVAN